MHRLSMNGVLSAQQIGFFKDFDLPSTTSLKKALFISAIAASIFASSYLACHHFGQWFVSTISITIINALVLPMILNKGTLNMIKAALIINLSSIATLSIGGFGGAVYLYCKSIPFFIESPFFALCTTYLLTLIIGYGISPFSEKLKKAYSLAFNHEEWHDRLNNLKEQFHSSIKKNSFLNSLLLFITLHSQKFASFLLTLNIIIPQNFRAMITFIVKEVELQQFKDLINKMEDTILIADYEQQEVPVEIQRNYINSLRTMLPLLKKENLSEAISILLSRSTILVPKIFDKIIFLGFFRTQEVLDATNQSIQKFLEFRTSWDKFKDRYNQLTIDILQLEQDVKAQNIDHLSFNEKNILSKRRNELSEEFSHLQKEIDRAFVNKRIWQNFAQICDLENRLPFENEAALLVVLQEQNFWNDIDNMYHSMIDDNQNQNPSLSQRLSDIKIKYLKELENEEPEQAYIFLSANKGFRTPDFEILQNLFNLENIVDLPDMMEQIGLGTEKDLFEKKILPEQDKQNEISKSQIIENIRSYYEKMANDKKIFAAIPQNEIKKTSPTYTIIEKVTHFVFYAIRSGLILVPALIQFEAAALGFSVGAIYFICKRFGLPVHHIGNWGESLMIRHYPKLLHFLRQRRLFSQVDDRKNAHKFFEVHFLERVKMINRMCFSALHISLFLSPGQFLQGLFFAEELANLIKR